MQMQSTPRQFLQVVAEVVNTPGIYGNDDERPYA